MKNKKLLLIGLSLALLPLTACGETGNEKYDKVARALKAVETTLTNTSNKKNKIRNLQQRISNDVSKNELEENFSGADTSESISEQISFTTPPLIQFKYLKAIYERIGSNYEFGTKYAYDITGLVYLDFETGYKDEDVKVENKYNYTFNLSVSLDMNEEDLITAYVGMDITLTKGATNYKSYRFVKMVLDYDFNKNDNNYELSLYDYSSESDLKYLNVDRNYEYDYAKVESNNLSEWRKLRYESSVDLYLDEAHPTLESYANEGVEIETDNARWYSDGTLRRVDRGSQQAYKAAELVYSKLGMNSTSLNMAEFFNKASTSTTIINDIYKETSRIYGDELIYHLVCKHKDEGGDGPSQDESTWPEEEIKSITGYYISPNEEPNVHYSHQTQVVDGTSILYIYVYNQNRDYFDNFEARLEIVYGFTNIGNDQYYLRMNDHYGYLFIINRNDASIAFTTLITEEKEDDYSNFAQTIRGGEEYAYPYYSFSSRGISAEKDVFNLLNTKLNDSEFVNKFNGHIVLNDSYQYHFELNEETNNKYGKGKEIFESLNGYLNDYRNKYSNWSKLYDNPNIFYFDRTIILIDDSQIKSGKIAIYSIHCDEYVREIINPPARIEVILTIIDKQNQTSENVSIYLEEGEDVREYLYDNGYDTLKIYLDSYFTKALDDSNSTVFSGMHLYYKVESEQIEQSTKVNYVLINNTGEMQTGSLEAVIGRDVREYLSDFENCEFYLNTGEPLDDSNCMVYKGMGLMIRILNQGGDSQNNKISIKCHVIYENGTLDEFNIEASQDEDVRPYFRDYDWANIYVDINMKNLLDENNCYAYQGMELYIKAKKEEQTETPTYKLLGVSGNWNYDYGLTGVEIKDERYAYELKFTIDLYDNTIFKITDGDKLWYGYESLEIGSLGEDDQTENHNILLGNGSYEVLFRIYQDGTVRIQINSCSSSGNEEETKVTINAIIYKDENNIEHKVIEAYVGEDISIYLGDYAEAEVYLDAALSEKLNERNCWITEDMTYIYIKYPQSSSGNDNQGGEEQTSKVHVYVFTYDSRGHQTGKDALELEKDEDVRSYLRKYNASEMYVLVDNQEVVLTYTNCNAYEGIMIKVIIR